MDIQKKRERIENTFSISSFILTVLALVFVVICDVSPFFVIALPTCCFLEVWFGEVARTLKKDREQYEIAGKTVVESISRTVVSSLIRTAITFFTVVVVVAIILLIVKGAYM
ncbi:MAG: hypothetical protein IJZ25_02290 [Lachnospiraceae bacterium]|nr:hypothetical protein [Lachnospiraceae bacterium]